jgi:hypothetical protein
MSVLIPNQKSFFFSSNPGNGAENVSADGTTFQVTLNSPMHIPKAAMYATIEIEQANIWNVSPNISADFANNLFEFTTTDAGNPGTHTITIADGLYSLGGLGGFLATSFTNLGLPGNLILLSGDDATGKTILTFLTAGDTADFTIGNSVGPILGFDSRLSPAAPQAAGFSDFADNSATFNRVNSYGIRSNLVSEGIPINNTAAGLLVSVPIDVSPGSQIVYLPNNPTRVDCRELIGHSKLNFQFSLVDQLLRPTPTQKEFYSFILTFRWGTLLTDKKMPMMAL